MALLMRASLLLCALGLVAARPHPLTPFPESWGSVGRRLQAAGYSLVEPFPLTPALFVFGDSLVDTGNILVLDPGSSTGVFPNGAFPDGRLNVTGRTTNGFNSADYFASFLGLPLTEPILRTGSSYFYGANFATVGAGALPTTGDPLTALPLANQTALFLGLAAKSRAFYADPSNSGLLNPPVPSLTAYSQGIYLLVIGADDVVAYLRKPTTDAATFVGAVLASISTHVTTLYAAGARQFLISNVGRIDCVPAIRNLSSDGSCLAAATPLVSALASGFTQLTAKLAASLPGANILLFDAAALSTAVIANPVTFGFSDATHACCGAGGPANIAIPCLQPGYSVCANPDVTFFWDSEHPTTAADRFTVREIFAGNTFIKPKNVLEAFVLPNLLAASNGNPSPTAANPSPAPTQAASYAAGSDYKCDSGSSLPYTCFNANGSFFACCASSNCPNPPMDSAVCGA